MIVLPTASKLSLCDVFLHTETQLGPREKGTVAKCGFVRSARQLAVEFWKCGAGMAVTIYENLVRQVERFQSSGSESLLG